MLYMRLYATCCCFLQRNSCVAGLNFFEGIIFEITVILSQNYRSSKFWSSWCNFTNIIRAAFSYESFARSFFVLRFKVCTFLRKNIGAKAACNMLVKLAPCGLEIPILEILSFETNISYRRFPLAFFELNELSFFLLSM
jgi:hypothetical protein